MSERDLKDEIWRLKKAQQEQHKSNENGLNEIIDLDAVHAEEGARINGLTASHIADKPARNFASLKTGVEEPETAGKVTELSARRSEKKTGGMTKLKPENATLGDATEQFAKSIKESSNETRNSKKTFQHSGKPRCPLKPRGLQDQVPIDMHATREKPFAVKNGGAVQFGGFWKPQNCHPVAKVAILIPYRKRPEQLKVFLNHMHPVMQRQMLEYRMFVVEQVRAFGETTA